MGRPTKTNEEKKANFTLRLTAADRAEITRNASLLGLSPAEFIRRRSLGYQLPGTLAAQRQEAVRNTALLRLGVNLNQITRHANAGRDLPEHLPELLAAIMAELDSRYDPGRDSRGSIL